MIYQLRKLCNIFHWKFPSIGYAVPSGSFQKGLGLPQQQRAGEVAEVKKRWRKEVMYPQTRWRRCEGKRRCKRMGVELQSSVSESK